MNILKEKCDFRTSTNCLYESYDSSYEYIFYGFYPGQYLYKRTYRGINSYSKNKIKFIIQNYKIFHRFIFAFLFFTGQNIFIIIFYIIAIYERSSNMIFNFFFIKFIIRFYSSNIFYYKYNNLSSNKKFFKFN